MRLPKYRLHKASGRAVVQWRPLFGKRLHYLPGAFDSRESREAFEDVIRRIHLAATPKKKRSAKRPPSFAPINQMLLAYLAWAESHYGKASSEFGHLKTVAKLLKQHYGRTAAADFGPLALKDLRERMIERGWVRTSINHQVDRVRRIFRWGVENEWVDAAVLANLRAVAGLRKWKSAAPEPAKVTPAKWEHVQAVLGHVLPMMAAMIEVHWLSGMRSGELVRMRTRDLDRSKPNVWVYVPDSHKNEWRGKDKIICLGPKSQRLIAPYLRDDDPDAFIFTPAITVREQNERRIANRITKHTPSSLALQRKPRRTRPRYDSRTYYHAVVKGIERANAKRPADEQIPHWHPHRLRHSRATITRESYGVEGAQAQLGNTVTATQIYAQSSFKLAAAIAHETG